MARRGREPFEKRQRELDRRKRAEAKRARRAERADADDDPEAGPSEDELLEQVRILHEEHAAEKISDEDFEARKAELFEQLGLE